MRHFIGSLAIALACLFFVAVAQTQESVSVAPAQAETPRLIQFSGVLMDHMGQPLTGVQGITFALYTEQSGGAPLWIETQNVALGEQGRYSVLLGSTQADGLPLEFFSSGEARWLGVQLNLPGETEQPRTLLVSVPYALKAADAETLGGQPLSSFVLADSGASSSDGVGKQSLKVAAVSDGMTTAAVTGGTPGTLGKFDTDGISLVNSIVTESGGNIGVGTPTPGAKLDVKGSGTGNVLLGELGGVPSYGAIGLANSLAPGSYNFTSSASDTNLFINRPTGKDIKFRENNGADQMTILSGGKVGIGTTGPTGLLTIGAAMTGTANSATFTTNAGALGTSATNEVRLASIGFTASNAEHLGIYGYRAAAGGDWTTTGIGLGMDVDNTARVGGFQLFLHANGNLGIGATSPTEKLEVAGNVKTNAIVFPDSTTQTTAMRTAALTRGITYIAGCDWCGVLADNYDQPKIYYNLVGPMTINSVTCFSDTGTPTIQIAKNGTNILSSNLTCSTSGPTTTSFSNNALNSYDTLDFVMVDADNGAPPTAHRVTVTIQATIN